MNGIELKFSVEARVAPLLVRLREFLAQQGIECYLVGGFVRDGLLGRANSDIDLTLGGEALAAASEVANAFGGRFVLLDEANKVARVVLPGDEGRRHLDFSAMRGSIEDDLAHRDFTINAIAVDLQQIGNGIQVVDPFAGCRDLEQGLIRAVSEGVFRQDPARLLRAVRLAAELGFSIEADTEALIRRDQHLIASVAGERVGEELSQLVSLPGSGRSLRQLDRLGLLVAVIPELATLKGVKQPKEHFWDVFDHSLEAVAAVERLFLTAEGQGDFSGFVPWSTVLARYFDQETGGGRTRKMLLKVAALLHDIAKPLAKTVEQSGRIRFLGHAKQGAEMTAPILERLRFSSREIMMVQQMVEHHLRPAQLSDDELPSRRAIYRYFRDTADVGIDTLFLSLADHLATRGPELDLAGWQRHAQTVEYILAKRFEEQSVVTPPKLIDGHDLLRIFRMRPGPRLGELLEAVREAQAAGEIKTREMALEFVQRELGEELCAEEIP